MSYSPLFQLELVLRVYRGPSNVSSIKCRVLICCICHFWGGSPFFVYFDFLCWQVSLVSNFCHWHEGVKVAIYLGSFAQFCWGEGGTLWTNTAGMWVVLTVTGPHWDCYGPGWRVLPSPHCSGSRCSTGHCPKWTQCLVHLPVLSRSGSPVLCKSTDPGRLCILCSSQVQVLRWLNARWAHCPMWALHLIHLPSPSHCFLGVPRLFWGADLRLWHSWPVWTIKDPRKMWLATAHSLVKDAVSGSEIAAAPCLPLLAIAHLPLCLWGGRAPNGSQLLLLWYLIDHKTLSCERTRGHRLALEPFVGEVLLFIFLSLWQPHSLGCYVTLAPSDFHQGIQAQSLPWGPMMQPMPACPAPTCCWGLQLSEPLIF